MGAVLCPLFLTGCPPGVPCDEEINDSRGIEQAVRSSVPIEALSAEFPLRRVDVSVCYVQEAVWVGVQLEIPAAYSEFGVGYTHVLGLSSSKEGKVAPAWGADGPEDLSVDAARAFYHGIIDTIESDPRVRELLEKAPPDPANPYTPLTGTAPVSIMRRGSRVEYSPVNHNVRGYLLSNDIAWEKFPEIAQAHAAIEERMLVGDVAGCAIGRGEIHNYTATEFHDDPYEPWRLRVALQCGDAWKDLTVDVKLDGTVERVESTSYNP